MAHGLETRVPFLDNDLVDFAMRVPVSLKLANLTEVVRLERERARRRRAALLRARRDDGKLLLRSVMARYVPAEVIRRRKAGLFRRPTPAGSRARASITSKRRLLTGRARIYDYLDRDAVHGARQRTLPARENRRLLIWSLLSVESWCEKFLDG